MTVDVSNKQQYDHNQLYLCQQCGITFKLANATVVCPICTAAGHDNIVPIYVENDPDKDQMYTESDFQAGD